MMGRGGDMACILCAALLARMAGDLARMPGSSSLLFSVTHVHFCPIQLYNEEILDLFDSTRDPDSRHRKSNIKIHEDASGSIYTTGVTSRLISSQDEVGMASVSAEEGLKAGMCSVGSKTRVSSFGMGQDSPSTVRSGLPRGAVLTL